MQDNTNNPGRRSAFIALKFSRYNMYIVALDETRKALLVMVKEMG